MRKLLLLLFSILPLTSFGQNIATISPQQCVWRAGDDPAWAAPSLDDSAWRPLAQFEQPDQPRFWVRCHADLSSLRLLAQPALQVLDNAAYLVYLDGSQVGANGNPRTGFHYQNSYETFSLDGSRITTGGKNTIAIRSFLRIPRQQIPNTALQVLAGDERSLYEHRASLVLSGIANWLPTAIGFGVIGVAGFVFLGLYAYDRSRPELLILAFISWGLSCPRILLSLNASHIRIWDFEYSGLNLLSSIGVNLLPFFSFWLNRRRVPLAYKVVISFNIFFLVYLLCGLLLPLDAAYRIDRAYPSDVVSFACAAFLSSSLIVAFWPWRAIAPRMRPLAICCFLFGSTNLLYQLPYLAVSIIPKVGVLYFQVQPRLLEIRAFCVITVIIALVALLLREQQHTTRERAELAGEMQAARAVQQVIIPEAIPSVPGFNLEGVYKPAGEVGGDFFQILATPGGGVLAVIGDVSGKGMPAAMTVSLLVGAVRTLADYTQHPGEILRAMNQRMMGRSHGGFTTCLVVRADPGGKLIAANAGHLAPYVNGEEMKIENGLPLGLAADTSYTESTFMLAPGDTLTLLSDGVVEARNAQGQLFGFERAAKLSTQPAEKVAQVAQAFGQEDDITVLTLSYAGVPAPA